MSTKATAASTRPRRKIGAAAAAQQKQAFAEEKSSSSSDSSSSEEEEEKEKAKPASKTKSSSTTTAPAAKKRVPSKKAKLVEEADERETAAPAPKTRKRAAPSNSSSSSTTSDKENASEQTVPNNSVFQCFANLDSALDVPRECDRLCALFLAEPEATRKDFTLCLNNILVEYKTTPQILLCVELMQACVSRQPSQFQVQLLSRCMALTKCKDRGVRLRAVNFIRYWLRAQTELLEDLHEPLVNCMLECTMDKNVLVRTEAVLALEFFQDPNDAKDRVISRLCQVSREDPMPAVRKACVKVLVPNEQSILALVERARDESAEVRTAVFRELRDRFQMEWFSAPLLCELFDQGLGEESCRTLLLKWFAGKNNVLSFLECFDLSAENERTLLRVMQVIKPQVTDLDQVPGLQRAGSSGEEVKTTEESFLLRVFAKPQEGDVQCMESFEQMMGEMQVEVEDEDEIAFICKNLLIAAHTHNVGELDRASKERIARQLIQSLLVDNFPVQLVEFMVPVLRQCFATPQQFIHHVVTDVLSVLSEHSPLEQVRADIVQAQALIQTYTKEGDYSALERLCSEIKQMQEREQMLVRDPNSASPVLFSKLARACAVAVHMCKSLPRQTEDTLLGGVLDLVCLPGVQSVEPTCRALAMELLGLLSLQDEATAKSHGLTLATTFLDNPEEEIEVRICAMRVIFDLLLCFGPGVTSSTEEFDGLVQHLMAYLDMSCAEEMRAVAAHGLAKLLFLNRVSYPGLVQCLLIVLFHPSSSSSSSSSGRDEAKNELRQCLTTFFAEYCNTPIVLKASGPLIQDIMFPSPDSLCEDLPMDKVLGHLSFLLRPATAAGSNRGLIQGAFAKMLMEKIAAYPTHEHVKALVNTLVAIPFAASNDVGVLSSVAYFATLLAHLLHENKTLSKQLIKFTATLKSMPPLAAADASEDVVVSEEIRNEVHSSFSAETLSEIQRLMKNSRISKALAASAAAAAQEEPEEEEEEEDSS